MVQILDSDGIQVPTPVNANDAATKQYVDNLKDKATKKETLTYATGVYDYPLLHEAKADSTLIFPKGGLPAIEGDDYTLSIVGGVTVVTLLLAFYSVLSNGDKIYAQYEY